MTREIVLSQEERDAKAQTVMVTGVTGFIGSRLVQRLLLGGHTVHGTCRNPDDTDRLHDLLQLEGAETRLKLFKADLLDANGFDEAIKSCSTVFHVASPYINGVKAKDAERKLFKPALMGTENVLNAVNRCGSVKRVIVTSSCVAIYGKITDDSKVGFIRSSPIADFSLFPNIGILKVYTEDDWNDDCSDDYLPYFASKVMAERKAWEMCNAQSRWTMVTMNPPAVLGTLHLTITITTYDRQYHRAFKISRHVNIASI